MKVFKFGGASVKDAAGVKTSLQLFINNMDNLSWSFLPWEKRQTYWKHYATPIFIKTRKRPPS